MGLRNFIWRISKTDDSTANNSQNKIICDTVALENLIAKWTHNERWKFENFADFIVLIEIPLPIKLSNLNAKANSFKCVSAINTEFVIALQFGNGLEHCSEIHVIEEGKIRIYHVNCNIEDGITVPLVTLESKIIWKNGKQLTCDYDKYSFRRILQLNIFHTLKIEIDQPNNYEEKSKIYSLQNCSDIENYLLGLDSSLVVSEVCDVILQFLGFTFKDILNAKRILVSFNETVGNQERCLERILVINGKLQ